MVTKVQWPYWKMYDSWVVDRRTSSRRNLHRFYGRAHKHSTSAIHKSYAASCEHPRKQRSVARTNSSQSSSSAQSLRYEIRGQISGGDWKTRAMCPRRRVEIGQEYPEAERKMQSYILLTYQRMVSPSAIRKKTDGKTIVAESGASMHMLSRKDLNSTELETVSLCEQSDDQRSREQKWNRVRVTTVYRRTFRRTQIVMSAWRRKTTRSSLQKTCWHSRALWWLDHSGSQSSQWRKWIVEKLSICRGVTSWSDSTSDAVLLIKEVEMIDFLDDL